MRNMSFSMTTEQVRAHGRNLFGATVLVTIKPEAAAAWNKEAGK